MLGFDALGKLAIGQLPGGNSGASIFEDSWHQPFPDAIRRLPPYRAATQPFSSLVEFAPFPETVSADKWFVPFSEPIRFVTGARSRPAMHTGAQQFLIYVEAQPFPETVSADRWFVPFSEPVRFRPRLNTANQLFFVSIEFPLTGSIVSETTTMLALAILTGVPTSSHKMLLAETIKQLIYTAEISPWTLS